MNERENRGGQHGRWRNCIEWPTLAVAAAIYVGFGLLTWYYHTLPWWLVLPLGGYLVAWHGSLQHEVVHGHPTRWAWANELVVFPSLWLWMPYRRYRDTHLTHHDVQSLTDPIDDPESFYLTPERWAATGRLSRGLLWLHNTSCGRMLLGPFHVVWRLLAAEARRVFRCDSNDCVTWLLHALACATVLGWVVLVCGIPLIDYLALFVYPGISLTLLRSFLEHQARQSAGHRTSIVESGPVMSLLYLNNNLHVVHHDEPALPWYKLPRRYQERRAELLAENGGYCYSGYGTVIARHLLAPREPVVYPSWRASRETRAAQANAAEPVLDPISDMRKGLPGC